MTNPLAYKPTEIPEGGIFKFSPSQFAKFIQAPHQWYRSEVLGEKEFSHSTSTVIGTIVHYCAEMVAKQQEVDKAVIEDYIDSLDIHEDYNPDIVRDKYLTMAECLVNDYVLENQFLEIETNHSAEVRDGYFAAGQLDNLQGTKEDCMIGDYKSYSSKTKPKSIPAYYKYQLLVYAWILIQNGYNPTRIRLIYVNRHIEGEISEKTNKQMKSYPPEVTVLTEAITSEDIEFIEGLLLLAVDSVEATKKYPELTHVIWHDPRLEIVL